MILKGILGLLASRKGTLCLILFVCSLAVMTFLCAIGRMDGNAFGISISAITSAVVAVFCHTQSRTDQIAIQQQPPQPPGPIL